MKKVNKKIWLMSSVSLVSICAVTGTTSMYFLTPSITRISQKGVYVLRQNTYLSNDGYKYDTSASYGNSKTNSLSVLLTNDLIHLKTEGRLKLNPETQVVERPSFQSYEFGISESVVVKLQNKKSKLWKELVFSSDEAEISDFNNVNSETVVEKDSNNPNSINNKRIFQKLISTGALNGNNITSPSEIKESDIVSSGEWSIKKIGFTVKPNIKWVDSNGNKTKYDVVAKDFWYSFMRSKLFDTDYRRANGGSKKLDEHFIKKTNAIQRFKETDRFPNEYLYEFFDLDSKKLHEENTAIEKTKDGRDMLVFNSIESVEITSGFSFVFKKFLPNNLQLSAAPSQHIDELNKNEKLNTIDSNLKIEGKARQFGIYTYGQTREKTLYASPYIPKVASENREIFEYNKHYANQEWIKLVEHGEVDKITKKNNKTLNKIVFEYAGNIDPSTYNSQLLNSYLQGTVSEIKYSDLTSAQRTQVYGNSPDLERIKETTLNNGLQYFKSVNNSSLVQRTLIQSNPSNKVESIKEYGFNENYSKLVFGLSLDELMKGNKTTTDSFFISQGLDFRLLIQAAINWDAYISQSYENQRVMWLNNAAQDAKFTSKPDSKAPINYYSEVNTLQFIDYEDDNMDISKAKLIDITPEDMKKHSDANISNNAEQMKSPKFSTIKKNIKNILNRHYKNNNLDSNQKVEWDVVYPWPDKDTIKVTVMENVVKTIQSLDSRLKPTLFVPDSRETMISKISKNNGVSDYNGWGYDYEGIGSYIAAFSNGNGVTILNAFAIFSQENPSDEKVKFLQKNYPQFTKLAKFIKTKSDKEMKDLSMDKKYWVENWDKVTNAQNQDSKTYFFEGSSKYDISARLPKLLKNYENENLSNNDWANLIRELNTIKGVSLDPDNSILNPNTANLALYLREYVIPLTKYGISYFQDYRYEDEN